MGVLDIRAYYDPEIDLLMVELPHGDAPPAEGAKLAPDVFVELEAAGAPLVLEVLRASEHYPAEWLKGVPAAPDEPGPTPSPAPHGLRPPSRSEPAVP